MSCFDYCTYNQCKDFWEVDFHIKSKQEDFFLTLRRVQDISEIKWSLIKSLKERTTHEHAFEKCDDRNAHEKC